MQQNWSLYFQESSAFVENETQAENGYIYTEFKRSWNNSNYSLFIMLWAFMHYHQKQDIATASNDITQNINTIVWALPD